MKIEKALNERKKSVECYIILLEVKESLLGLYIAGVSCFSR